MSGALPHRGAAAHLFGGVVISVCPSVINKHCHKTHPNARSVNPLHQDTSDPGQWTTRSPCAREQQVIRHGHAGETPSSRQRNRSIATESQENRQELRRALSAEEPLRCHQKSRIAAPRGNEASPARW